MTYFCNILQGDALEVLKTLESGSVHCVVTSPPYWNLRDYSVDGQLGLEQTPAEFIAKMVEVFKEVYRVLRKDGTLWLNIGDKFVNDLKWGGSTGGIHTKALHGKSEGNGRAKRRTGFRAKETMGMPWRLAFALQDAGWRLRQEIIWHKTNATPESARDRCTKSHEYIFLLTKAEHYYYDAFAIREPASPKTKPRRALQDLTKQVGGWANGAGVSHSSVDHATAKKESTRKYGHVGSGVRNNPSFDAGIISAHVLPTRNKRSVWSVPTQPFKAAHFATFPEALIKPCILAGTSEKGACAKCGAPYKRITSKSGGRTIKGDSGVVRDRSFNGSRNGKDGTLDGVIPIEAHVGWKKMCKCETDEIKPCVVLDPFSGAATTGLVCLKLRTRRNYIGIELNPEYIEMSQKRLQKV